MKIEQIKDLLDGTQGRFFTATFVKKDGSLRRMNCRAGVKRHSNGGRSTVRDKAEYYTVYDCQAKGYRNINMLTLRTIRMDGVTMSFGTEEYLSEDDVSYKIIEGYEE